MNTITVRWRPGGGWIISCETFSARKVEGEEASTYYRPVMLGRPGLFSFPRGAPLCRNCRTDST